MIVSTKGRYALRVMIDLAEHQADKYVRNGIFLKNTRLCGDIHKSNCSL